MNDDIEPILVSACLNGKNCRYNASNALNQPLIDNLKNKLIIECCPEIMAGLPIPRASCNIHGGDGFDVLTEKAKIIGVDGKDYTQSFIYGANIALEKALKNRVKKAYLKDNSPSCGHGKIYSSDGTTLINGSGVFAALLKQHNIEVEAI